MLTEKQLDIILFKLKNTSEYRLEGYARKSLIRRIERFMVNHKTTPDKIVFSLANDKSFAAHFVNELTVNTTELFRDPRVWNFLQSNVLNKLVNRHRINIWVAGSSTGQEVYSLMIMLNELDLLDKSHIVATDINQEVIEKAKLGRYKYRNNQDYLANFDAVIKRNPLNFTEIKDVPYDKYFTIDKARDEIIMNDFLRNKPIYLQHDLVMGGNLEFTKFDFILCRNVLIYFNQELQNQVLNMFHKNLFPNSFLLLGVHESILGPATQLYLKKGNIYINK